MTTATCIPGTLQAYNLPAKRNYEIKTATLFIYDTF